ncbi:MAG: hypothetical protein RMX96_29465 [Nostoc sp. ChiSLP02]|nr:hypothetical protein [Nostoc sp. ChiSLP02]
MIDFPFLSYEYIFILLMNLDRNLNERIRIYTERSQAFISDNQLQDREKFTYKFFVIIKT